MRIGCKIKPRIIIMRKKKTKTGQRVCLAFLLKEIIRVKSVYTTQGFPEK